MTGEPMGPVGGLLADVPLPLLVVTRRALETLARHWPKAMAAATGRSEAADAFVRDYALACQGADLDAIEPAAQQWVATGKYYPKPAELGTLARNLSRPSSTPVAGPSPHVREAEAQLAQRLEVGRVQAMNTWAYEQLGSMLAVMAVWARLMEQATRLEQRQLIQAGRVDRKDFREAVLAVKAEREAKQQAEAAARHAGPLAEAVSAVVAP
ncbi:hypothetical protein [Gemmatimonas sp. UBA7669]|uniref:hypothetical protein n=1 Tax=Gemmatimonas sp. UBA7669 TaxID=1946568 RepID=UPI0025C1267E|nr:hypothetical protein [Gemmatimonas sp. UBA7669]